MERIDRVLGYDESLKIIQESEGFNFSIDSTLLSFFISPKPKQKRIIDLGCGNGIIPLLLSYMTKEKIVGVEINKDSSSRAKRSVELNKLESQIEIINENIKNLKDIYNQASFDLVVSNPPYFRLEDSKLKNEDLSVRDSRHETLIDFKELSKIASYLLTDKGSFGLVHRVDRLIEILDTLKENRLFPKRIRFVYPIKGKESHIFLMEAVKNGSSHGLKIEEPLYIYNEDGSYSEEVRGYFNYKNEKK